jgi:hypothetical protein
MFNIGDIVKVKEDLKYQNYFIQNGKPKKIADYTNSLGLVVGKRERISETILKIKYDVMWINNNNIIRTYTISHMHSLCEKIEE